MKYLLSFSKIKHSWSNWTHSLLVLSFLFFAGISCKKLIVIPPPVNSITTTEVFASPVEAVSAISGIYADMITGNASFFNYAATVTGGLSADEFTIVNTTEWTQFARNNLYNGNHIVVNSLWKSLYTCIYKSNAIVERLQHSPNIPDSLRQELYGEALFIRAFCNFYLVNLFGPIPLVTTVNWRNTNLLSRTPVEDVYNHIISDLKNAKELLASDYSVGRGERIIPNKWAASALLARVYLYTGDWANTIIEAGNVINNANMFLEPVTEIFKTNSREAIWQLKQSNTWGPAYNVTPEGYYIRPRTKNASFIPNVWVTYSFLNNFQQQDQRKLIWIDSTVSSVNNQVYYFPGKYTQGAGEVVVNGVYKQYYMVLRLAEQYLIRAEAYLKQNRQSEAISDINQIRQRAGLSDLDGFLSVEQIMEALMKERQIELFAEWGHRWLDLKRWRKVDEILGALKESDWQTTDKLYPIPLSELNKNPNMTQNEGY